MKRHVVVIGFGATLAASCLAQQTSWKTEHHDGLLVAPHATGVQYVTWPRGPDELTYSVQESYPATRLRKYLCDDLTKKGWHAKLGCSDADQWWKTPYTDHGTTRTSYRRQITFVKEDGEVVYYLLDYGAENGESYLQKLHVQAVYSVGKPEPPKPLPARATAQVKAEPSMIDFGAVKLGSVSPLRAVTYTFQERTELQDISVLTSGEQRLDFADAGTDSCRANVVYKPGDSCTVRVTFSPRLAAVRRGFVLLQETSGPAVMTNLEGTGTGESGQTGGSTTVFPRPRVVDAGGRVTAIIPDHPVELGQPLRITLNLTDPHVIGIAEEQGEGDHTFSNISSGFAVGSGDARIVSDTGLAKTMEVIPLGVGKLTFGIMVFFADGGIAQKSYTLEVAPSSKGLKNFFLNHGSRGLAIVLEDKPEDRQSWLSPEVSYRQLEYPIYLEDSSQIKFTVQQAADKPVILLDPNGMVHGLRPGKATIIGDFDGVKDELVVTVYTKESAPAGYRRIRP